MAAQCATESLDNPLWQFALDFYPFEDAETILLECQQQGADVLLLLGALWLATDNGAWPDDEEFDSALEGYLSWRQSVVVPLRHIRLTLPKAGRDDVRGEFRERVKDIELEAEHLAMAGLHGLLDEFADECPQDEPLRVSVTENLRQALVLDGVDVSPACINALVDNLLAFVVEQSRQPETPSTNAASDD
ncbi:TIGR02444 family protein [Oceanobacter mangrovi]|uniref:TIGR02444 family protein n=1 Tax=Oceanobacter mangrovi TaxID=2862510 RepID=UPI001C8D837C|nr:TIGR02444 family protein [Oceanobacter mangrovi]